jgi:hypothetical protein
VCFLLSTTLVLFLEIYTPTTLLTHHLMGAWRCVYCRTNEARNNEFQPEIGWCVEPRRSSKWNDIFYSHYHFPFIFYVKLYRNIILLIKFKEVLKYSAKELQLPNLQYFQNVPQYEHPALTKNFRGTPTIDLPTLHELLVFPPLLFYLYYIILFYLSFTLFSRTLIA